jgi:hypothetical protein
VSGVAWACALSLAAVPARAQERCPNAQYLPQLTISEVQNPAVPVVDRWQVLFRDVPISDAQLAALAHDDPMIDLTREEMDGRGSWVYLGLATAALGAIVSSVGWYLYGANESRPANDRLPIGLTLAMGLGGVVVGAGGTIMVTEAVQRPLEPHVAPTPIHRLTRDQVRALVTAVNEQLYREICEAADDAKVAPPRPEPPEPPEPPPPPAE